MLTGAVPAHAPTGTDAAGAVPRIAVLIPCHNEEVAIPRVVAGFRSALPAATVHVYDNNSTDRTAEAATAAGAVLRREHRQGKGHVVRRMFADIDADVYLLVDGDDTYDPAAAPAMVHLLLEQQLDMVTGVRVTERPGDKQRGKDRAYRRGHRFGNAAITWTVCRLFGGGVTDTLSGYRVLSRRFAKSFPALATGFETETELTVHALELRLPIAELPVGYRERPEGSASKLRTWRDGARILRTLLLLVQRERPLAFFAVIGAALLALGVGLALPVFETYLETGLVPRLPTAVLSTGLVLLSFLSLACGLILDTVTRGRLEAKRIAYLQIPAPSPSGPP
jgi:glycosyltransferase involved in cell wall biosynthesis